MYVKITTIIIRRPIVIYNSKLTGSLH